MTPEMRGDMYGSTPYEGSPEEGFSREYEFNPYGSTVKATLAKTGHLLPFQRRRLNIVGILVTWICPCILFTVVFAVLSFKIRYNNEYLSYFIVACCLLVVLFCGVFAGRALKQKFTEAGFLPTWIIVMAILMALAWMAGVAFGDYNYEHNLQPYYDSLQLNTYTDVRPERLRGQMLMDAGRVTFVKGTKLDLSKSMGFKNVNVYCVAPIVFKNVTPPTYDFWAVGTNCCSGNYADFHCRGFNDESAHGGFRLMRDFDRAYYRLAVQQAESTYKLRAVHPLFFTWVKDPLKLTKEWYSVGQNFFIIWVVGHALFQTLVVIAATLAFARLGFW